VGLTTQQVDATGVILAYFGGWIPRGWIPGGRYGGDPDPAPLPTGRGRRVVAGAS